MLEEALYLAALGWRVHPVHGIVDGVCTCGLGASCRSAGKHPVLSSWVTEASADPAAVRSWSWERCNLGVVPSGFVVLDFDGSEGIRTLERMGAHLPELPDTTPIARTGSGGIHLYLAGEAKTRARVLPGFDVRGIGGQAVVPPSRHFSGTRYEWLNPPCSPPPAPEWLAVAQGEIPDELRPPEIVTREDLRAMAERKHKKPFTAVLAGQPFAPRGSRNATAASLCGLLARRFPWAEPGQVAELFRDSLRAMGEPTEVQLISMLQRFQLQVRTELARKPRIRITVDIDEMADQAIEILGRRAEGLYSRGGQLMRVRPSEALPDGILRGELPYQFELVEPANLRAILSSLIAWHRVLASGAESSQYPPEQVVSRIAKRGEWPGVPHGERITEGMVLRPDGSVFPGGGYDPVTGTICMGPPDRNPLCSVSEALDLLGSLVVDFPFASSAHYSAWLASVLTGVGQPLFRGPSPLFLIDANVRGSGKTLLAELSILISTGKGPARAALGQDNVEDRKQITSLAMDGAQAILIDNVVGLFGTGKLCEALSLHDSGWSDRVLGKSLTWSGAFKPTWFATANNIRLQPDIARRTCYCRLSSPLEHPELRSGFRVPALMAHVQEHRQEIYRAAVSVLHHYLRAGRPERDLPPWGTYEGWSGIVRQALVWVGLADPADTRAELSVADEEQELIQDLLEGLLELGKAEFTPGGIAGELYGPVKSAADFGKYAKLRDALDAGCVQRQANPTPQSIGRLLSRFRDRVSGGLRLVKTSRKGSYWRVEGV